MQIYCPIQAEPRPSPVVSEASPPGLEDDSPQPFPTECLPPAVAAIVRAVADSERVPAALPGLIALGVLSGCIGAGLAVRSGPQRTTRGNLFVIAAAESGSGKSETFRLLAAPLLEHQQQQIEHYRSQTGPGLQADLRVLDRMVAHLERKAATAADPSERQKLQDELTYHLAQRDEAASRAHPPLLLAADVTTEKLAVLLQQNGEVLFSASADARKLVDNILGRYGSARMTDESLYLAAFSGDFVRVDRQGRDPVTLREPCLALLWLLQPDVLDLMLAEASLTAGGFLPRALVAHSQATPRRIEDESPAIAEPVREAWKNLLCSLLEVYRRQGVRHVVNVTPDAMQLFTAFHNQVVARREVDLSDVGSFAARWAEQAWRLSVVLHAATWGSQAHDHSLSADTATQAIRLAQWFAAEQLDLLARGRQEHARKLEDKVLEYLDRLWKTRQQDTISVRQAQRARIQRTSSECQVLLDRMVEDGLLQAEETIPPSGGTSRRLYRRATSAGRQ